MDDPIPFGDYEEGRYVNYWHLDPTLRRELKRVYSAQEFSWAEPHLAEFGALVGHTVAENADLIDADGPELETYDRHGAVHNHVRYPAEQYENEIPVDESALVESATVVE